MRVHLALDVSDFDGWIADAIRAARELTEAHTNRRWIEQTLRLTLSDWPDCLDVQDPAFDLAGIIRLPVEPVSSIQSVSYLDADGVEQTIDAEDLDTWLDHNPPLVSSGSWPTVGDYLGAVRVTFVAGYASAEAVPGQAKVAMKLAIANWYENRADQNVLIARGLPPAAKAMLEMLWNGALGA